MSQFRKADSSVYSVFLEMLEKVFPNLSGYSFGLLFRETIKKSRGGMIFAEICQPTKLLSYYAKNDDGNPFDFLIIVDEMVWACARDEDRIRIIRHELRHVHISSKGVAKMIGHDFQDFYIEVDLNVDDASWAQKLGEITTAGYDQVKAGSPDPRLERKDETEYSTNQRQTHLPLDTVDKMASDAAKEIVELAEKSHENVDKIVEDAEAKPSNGGGPADDMDVIVKKDFVADESVGFNLDELARKKGLLPEEAAA